MVQYDRNYRLTRQKIVLLDAQLIFVCFSRKNYSASLVLHHLPRKVLGLFVSTVGTFSALLSALASSHKRQSGGTALLVVRLCDQFPCICARVLMFLSPFFELAERRLSRGRRAERVHQEPVGVQRFSRASLTHWGKLCIYVDTLARMVVHRRSASEPTENSNVCAVCDIC